MARPLRGVVVQAAPRAVKTHLIEEYKARAKTVRCDCGWFGSADDFALHRREVGATSSS